ncbi:MAG: adenylate/guanylate cyclase domain-containing protein [Alphaproteobacteria bacterium]|nr:adenylate/guanylate cyclase domain-containing protein [Alphaproteobacteria bacterium]
MGVDEEGTLAALKAHRRELIDPLLGQHKGRIVKTTGDGMLIEFASVIDAVRCAVVIQQGMEERNAGVPEDQRIRFRVGINLGDIIVEDDDIFGDGVNVAARLEALSKPGEIYVSASVRDQVGEKLPLGFADMGEHSVKNIARPIHVYRVEKRGQSAGTAIEGPRPLALPDRPSIAVLPFQNMSGDAEQDYFCDGMVEDIITGLSRIKWLFVIARNSTFVYKGRAVDVKQVGRDLGVRYVLEGSVRRGGNRVRITGQLIEAETGRHVWAERYDRPLDDIFALQDEMTINVVGAIEPSLRQAEIERVKRERPDSLHAYDLLLRALPDVYVAMPDEAERALQLLDRALALEPDYALAHAYAAWCHEIRFVRAGQQPAEREAALRHAHAALANGPDDATALAFAGFTVAQIAHDMATARSAFERALSISPSSFIALSFGGAALAWKGDAERAIEWGERAVRLSPFDRMLYAPCHAIALGNLVLGHNDKAAEAARQAVHCKPEFSLSHFILASALARAGRVEEAKSAGARGLALQPGFSIRELCAALAIPESLARPLTDGLTAAGIPG